jgi:cytochrome c
MKSRFIAGVTVAAALLAVPAWADDVGTAEEAKVLLTKALDHIAKAGAAVAYKDFTDTKGAFVDRDLYVFCLDAGGNMTAHGGNPAMLGKNLKAVKDSDGKEFVAEMLKIGAESGTGSVDYKWSNPTTKKIEAKSSFITKVADGVCGVGIYKK